MLDFKVIGWLLGAVFLLVGPADASTELMVDDPEAYGKQIMEEVDERESGYGDYNGNIEMILRDRKGRESVRFMRAYNLEVEDDGDKRLLVFRRPPDIDGTALLTYTHISGQDDQWLYMPAMKRVKRIASGNQSGSFVGSEFAYEDLTSQEVAEYTYSFLDQGSANDLDCFVIERIPKREDSGYSRQVVWVDKEHYRYQKIEYYDRRGDLLKTLTLSDYKLYAGEFWRAKTMDMVNQQTGKSTTLLWESITYRTGLAENDFSVNALKRAR